MKLSVIVPVYNCEQYLVRCFDHLIHPLVQVIIVNDGSTDGSKGIIDSYCQKYSNFMAIHTENQGAVKARSEGLKHIQTEYFTFVDSDDYCDIQALVSLCDFMSARNVFVGNGRSTVYLSGIPFPFHSRKWNKSFINFKKDKRDFTNTTCTLWGKVFHSELRDYFISDSSHIVYEDMEMVYPVLAKSEKMIHTNQLLYSYCMRSSSTSALGLSMNNSKGLEGLLSAIVAMQKRFQDLGLYKEYQLELDSIAIKLIYQRMSAILRNPNIINKREMMELVLHVLDAFIPNWRNNPYYLEKFKESEYNDYIFYKTTELALHVLKIKSHEVEQDYRTLLQTYNLKLELKKN